MYKLHQYFLLSLFSLLCSTQLTAQLVEDFNDGNISDGPVWTGDLANFIVNDAGELQLMAPEAGESFMYHSMSYPDTIQMDFTFRLEMSPSSSNFGIIYLGLDTPDIEVANGYYLQIGESGSNDAIKLYRLDFGNETLLATATESAIASDPAQAKVCLTIYPDGLISLSTDYDLSGQCEFELDVIDNIHSFDDLNTFGFYCKYTETRKENFFYDDISIIKLETDQTPPSLVALEVTSAQSLSLTFDEPLSAISAESVSSYMVNNGIGEPVTASLNGANVTLNFDETFQSGIEYQVAVMGVSDIEGNTLVGESSSFVLSIFPDNKDLRITEILFDPFSGGTDFIELYNDSDKFLNLEGLVIENIDKDESKTIPQEVLLLPGEYICFTEDKDFLIATYPNASPERIIEIDLPSWNNEDGNASISHPSASVDFIDQFDYREDLHFALIDDTEGVSLERISISIDTQLDDNWHSASSASGFATPGSANSNAVVSSNSEDELSLTTKLFSPNDDGKDDFLIINFNLDKVGFVANIKIFDDEGFERKQLTSNSLLGRTGFVTWDGTNEEGNISEIGMYIVVAELFHPDGDVKNFKIVCALADFIE